MSTTGAPPVRSGKSRPSISSAASRKVVSGAGLTGDGGRVANPARTSGPSTRGSSAANDQSPMSTDKPPAAKPWARLARLLMRLRLLTASWVSSGTPKMSISETSLDPRSLSSGMGVLSTSMTGCTGWVTSRILASTPLAKSLRKESSRIRLLLRVSMAGIRRRVVIIRIDDGVGEVPQQGEIGADAREERGVRHFRDQFQRGAGVAC
jgi:hypothetical protein